MKTKPKILYLLQCYHNRGGVEEHTRDLARGLAADFDIRVVAPEKNQLVVIKDEQIYATYPADEAVWPVVPYTLETTQRSLGALLDEFKPDLIHVQHFLNWHIGVLDQLLATGKPVLVSFHDYYTVTPYYTMQGAATTHDALTPEYSMQVFRTDISQYLSKRFTAIRSSLERCAARICPSAFLASQLGAVVPAEFMVIEHGIEPFKPTPLITGAKKRFAFVGSKLPQKGWMELLKAFQVLKNQRPEAELYFFGGGQKAPSHSSPGVTFFPAYNPEELPDLMSRFEIGVIPSMFAETFSYVLSELWTGGKAVAASRIGTLGTRIQDGVNGKFFEPGDIGSMVKTMSWFLDNDEWRSWTLPQSKHIKDMLRDYKTLYERQLGPNG